MVGGGSGGVGMSPANAGTESTINNRTDLSIFMGISLTTKSQGSIATLVASAWLQAQGMEFLAAEESLSEAGYGLSDCNDPDVLLTQATILCYRPNGLSEAKDKLTKSVRLFGDNPRGARAQITLAWVYWLGGETAEAKDLLRSIRTEEYRYCFLVTHGLIESDPEVSLGFYAQAEPFAAKETAEQQAKFHNVRAMALRALSDNKAKNRSKDLAEIAGIRDRSEMEYIAALGLAQQSGAYEIELSVLNNIGGLYRSSARHKEAHRLIDDVILRLSDGKHPAHLGKAQDQRATTFLDEGKLPEAIQAARRAVETLEHSDRDGWLAEALITLGTALARKGEHAEAHSQLQRAAAICDHVGDKAQADKARLNIITELPISCEEAFLLFTLISDRVQAIQAISYRLEAESIRIALETTRGSKLKAANILGMSRQALEKKIENNFPQFLTKPKRKRRRVLFSRGN